ncbi:MAG: signal recognition particle-docking protein FtsY [Aestuariivirga sp.]
MSGFFKKLFNRITGKGNETPTPVEEVVVPQIEAPKPVAPEIPEAVVEAKPEPVPAPKKMEVPEPVLKKVEAKKLEPKKPEPKAKAKSEPKKIEVKKPEPKAKAKPEPKKIEVKKPEPKKPEQKKPEAPKPAPKKPEPKKPESKKAAAKTAPIKVEIAAPPATPPPPVVEKQPETVVQAPVPVPAPEPAPRRGWLSRLTQGLSKSSKSITTSITSIFTKRKLDAATLEELEDVLIQADLGIAVSERIIRAVSAGRYDKEIEPEEVKRILAEEVAKVLKPVEVPFNFGSEKPFVVLVVGVNGAGKTTTIGKLGAIATAEGFKVMFAACDTFRAAAIEQLTIWGERIGAKTLSRPTGSDSSGLAYDAMQAARDDGTDILFIDTAGRLQNKAYLMDELDKIVRVVKKQDATAPHAVLLILDATTGQNAISQAEIFTKVAGVTGLIMTKLDGTARGGILVAIAEKFALPIHAIGVGESIDDLQPFDADAFARAISGLGET